MKTILLLLACVAITSSEPSSAFTTVLEYGCSTTECTYRFVVPEPIAAYVDPNLFEKDLFDLQTSLDTLDGTIKNMAEPPNGNDFNTKWEEMYPGVNATVLSATADVKNETTYQSENYNNLKNCSATDLKSATALACTIACTPSDTECKEKCKKSS